MRSKDMARRGFLQRAGASAIAVSGMTLVPGTSTLAAQETAGLKPIGVPYDVQAFGAAGDGKTIDSPAINRAIDAAAANGGGTVYLRAGNYLCYSIHLKSKVALFLDQGVTIVAADPGADAAQSYDPAESNKPWEGYQDYGHN